MNKDNINLTILWENMQVIDDKFEEFAQKRHDGAEKIAKNAKEKGGPAMLTYHHFIVKLPHYKKAAAGNLPNLTGIGQEYEPPLNAEIILDGTIDLKSNAEIVLEIAK